ncbi:preprotein translocase subunit SecG [Desulfovibrio sp.]|uniref:preprotein translocase subunit SecG n=1 Tax=Desulfovibrio sp. TaxID=885 RepID=UPI0023C1D1CB|nr:preprotein translocase subunit SecG [Desulfovibrio sp.]MDE7241209.1 preprotein translocase subunit SecG [Desulfovibrio sp.]
MQTLILTLHIIVCVLLVILILLQSGKEGMGVIFGGGNTSVFGSSGAGGILAKLTTLMAIIFVITSLSYTYVTSARPSNESTILNVKIEEPEAPAEARKDAPAPEAAAPKADAPQAGAPQAAAPQAAAPAAAAPAQPGKADAPATAAAPQKP